MLILTLGIFLKILKIIGLVMGIALLVILSLLLLILFVPIRYRLFAYKKSKDSKLFVKANVSWLLKFINAKINYYDKCNTQEMFNIYILGINIKKLLPKKNSRKNKKKKSSNLDKDKNDSKTIENDNNNTNNTNINSNNDNIFTDSSNKNKEQSVQDYTVKSLDKDNYDSFEDDTKTKKHKENKTIFDKISDAFSLIICKIKNTINSLKQAVKKAQNLSSFIFDEKNKLGIKRIFASLKYLLKKIRPRIKKFDISYGLDDPYKMGQSIAIISILYGLIGKEIAIHPYFDEGTFFYGRILLKGKIRIFTLITICIKLYFNEDFKNLINNSKKISQQL